MRKHWRKQKGSSGRSSEGCSERSIQKGIGIISRESSRENRERSRGGRSGHNSGISNGNIGWGSSRASSEGREMTNNSDSID